MRPFPHLLRSSVCLLEVHGRLDQRASLVVCQLAQPVKGREGLDTGRQYIRKEARVAPRCLRIQEGASLFEHRAESHQPDRHPALDEVGAIVRRVEDRWY